MSAWAETHPTSCFTPQTYHGWQRQAQLADGSWDRHQRQRQAPKTPLAAATLVLHLDHGGSAYATALIRNRFDNAPATESAIRNPQSAIAGPVVLVVVGASGTPEYATEFAAGAKLWGQACAKSGAKFVSVGLDEAGTASDREHLREILVGQEQQDGYQKGEPSSVLGSPSSPLWLVLIGHGTFDGRTAKFNLRGPDLSANDLAEWLKPLQRPIAVIDTTSSSAPFLKELSAPGRVIITATKSGFEQNYARFGRYLAEAIIDPKADLDKDGQTSLLEAFLSASHAASQFYAGAGRLATEHALLDDNGDGLGTPAEWFRGIRPVQRASDGAALDGYRAHQFCLLPSPAEAALPPETRAERDRLELQVMALRDTRAKLSDDEYFSTLEPLLREIARIYEGMDPISRKQH